MSQYGVGLYTLADAARLLHVKSRDVRRWMFGYDFTSSNKDGERHRHHSNPLWIPQYAGDPDLNGQVIGFRDLLELRIVREFVHHGVPLVVIRRCLEAASKLFESSYPFTAHRFLTDGRTVFHQAVQEGAERDLLDLRTLQFAFKEVIKPSLYAGIEYEGELARRWYPEPKRKAVVVDPAIQFGKPTLTESSVSTEALYLSYQAEGGDASALQTVAAIYELPVKAVKEAVRFETSLAAA